MFFTMQWMDHALDVATAKACAVVTAKACAGRIMRWMSALLKSEHALDKKSVRWDHWNLEEEEEERVKDLKRYVRLAVAWDRRGSPVPRWT